MSRSSCQMLSDLSPMPYGQYKGLPMQDIAASYFHYLWVNGKDKARNDPVADYIRANLFAFKKEHKDGIW